MKRACIIVVLLAILLGSTTPGWAGEVFLSAAASLRDALQEIGAAFQRQHPETVLRSNIAASGSLAKQIAQGAPADLYLSANPRWMEYLVTNGSVPADMVRTLAMNRLVFIGPADSPMRGLQDLGGCNRIAIGSTNSVPAGQYAKQVLEKAGIYQELAAAGKLVLAKDVRQALIYVERGEVDGGFVYRTDALLARRSTVLFEVEQTMHKPISYPLALTMKGQRNPDAVAFYHYLSGEEAAAILRRFGFALPAKGGP